MGFLEILVSMGSLFQSFGPRDDMVLWPLTMLQWGYKFIRRWSCFYFALVSRGKHFIHVLWGQFILLFEDMGCNVLFKYSSNWKPIYFFKLSNPNVRSVTQGQTKSNALVLTNLKFVWKFILQNWHNQNGAELEHCIIVVLVEVLKTYSYATGI